MKGAFISELLYDEDFEVFPTGERERLGLRTLPHEMNTNKMVKTPNGRPTRLHFKLQVTFTGAVSMSYRCLQEGEMYNKALFTVTGVTYFDAFKKMHKLLKNRQLF